MSVSRSVWPSLLVLFGGLSGCLVSPSSEDELARIGLELDLPQTPGIAAALAPRYWDAQGRFFLADFPKFVQVTVEHEGRPLASASWPDPERGIGEGEGPGGEVSLQLEVPAGRGRRLQVVGFFVDLDSVMVYQQAEEVTVELVAGQVAQVPVRLQRAPTGTVDVTVRCEAGNQGPSRPSRLTLVDELARVVYPARPLSENLLGALGVRLPAVAVGRPLLAQVELQNVDSGATALLELRRTFAVEVPNETKPVLLTVPCGF